jgi:hypothetical protein
MFCDYARKFYLSIRLTQNFGFRYLEAVDCGHKLGIVHQVTRSGGNGTYWIRMTFSGLYDLKFGI